MAIPLPITPEIAAAYSLCKRKAFFLLRGDAGESIHEYVTLLEAHAATSRNGFFASLQAAGLTVQQCRGAEVAWKGVVLAQVLLRNDDLEAVSDALVPLAQPAPKGQPHYEPHLVIGSYAATKDDKIRLAFVGLVLAKGYRHRPPVGVIINVAGEAQRIQLTKLMASLDPAIDILNGWKNNLPSEPPPVILNDHCPICPFRTSCLAQAERDDSLTLLDRLTPKVMRKYHKKGIFTITQLSFLFKPRRQGKKRKERPVGFIPELQALALRTGKIYLHQTPTIPQHSTELFLDVEGVPDHGSHYLIGLVIRSEGQAESHSWWADSSHDEKRILEEFVALANRHPDGPIFHYGSYEPKALQRMANASEVDIDPIMGRLVNVNTFIFGKVYFPARSNTLKELGRLFGATWSSPDASGLQSVVWRMQWQASREANLKEQLLAYNIEDCNALAILVSELRKIGQSSTARPDVDFADAPKRNATPSGKQIHDSLEGILKSAHAEYRKNRIGIREHEGDDAAANKRHGGQPGHPMHRRITPAKASKVVRVKRRIKCPRHKGYPLLPTDKKTEHTILDLVFTRNGCRKKLIKYVGAVSYCPRCKCDYVPAIISRLQCRFFGHCFRAWVVYQRITLRLPYRVIVQVIYDLFREQVSPTSVMNFVSDLAEYYASTEKTLLKKILASPFIHVDETKLNIQGANYYVWVLTDGQHVVFRLTETREPTLIQEMLKNYTGILLSDFYGGYDACLCRQQKCLVHLIRDLNDGLWKNPFNSELEGFVSAVRDLLVPIMADVDKYGLKRRHLHKHKHSADRFFRNVIDAQKYKCEITQTYQKRFLRYRESLFRFLNEDGIPWNNNMAERASRHLAVQRKISGSFFQRVAEHYLLLLGIAQTCRFRRKSFLAFLLSKEKDLDEFKEKRRPKATKLIGKHAKGPDVGPTDQDEAE
jgi:predicted RecB family nuclease